MARKPGPVSSDGSPPPALFSTLVASRPRREGGADVVASLASIAVHVAGVGLLFWLTMVGGQAERQPDPIPPLVIPIEPAPPKPVIPPITDAPPAAEPAAVRIGSTTITAPTVILPDMPPPAVGSPFDPRDYSGIGPEGRADGNTERAVTTEDVDAAPMLTPMTVRPVIRNRDEVARALLRYYPSLLRDAGVGGTVVVWIRIDERGNVIDTRIHQSSGQAGLDDAALRIGDVIEFTPAMNRDRAIPVWIQWPIVFRPI